MEKFKEGDVVEIISSDSKNYKDALDNNKHVEGYNRIADFVGQRFIVTSILKLDHNPYEIIFGNGNLQKKDYEVIMYKKFEE